VPAAGRRAQQGREIPNALFKCTGYSQELADEPCCSHREEPRRHKKATTNPQSGHLQDARLTKALATPALFYARLFSLFTEKKPEALYLKALLAINKEANGALQGGIAMRQSARWSY
jgi:hypothetical protein